MFAWHLKPIEEYEIDFVAVAVMFAPAATLVSVTGVPGVPRLTDERLGVPSGLGSVSV